MLAPTDRVFLETVKVWAFGVSGISGRCFVRKTTGGLYVVCLRGNIGGLRPYRPAVTFVGRTTIPIVAHPVWPHDSVCKGYPDEAQEYGFNPVFTSF